MEDSSIQNNTIQNENEIDIEVFNNMDENKSYIFELQKDESFLYFQNNESNFGPTAVFIDEKKDENNENIIEYIDEQKNYVCVKKIEKPYEDWAKAKLELKYLTILTQIKHENFAKLKEIYISNEKNIYIFSEYIPTSVERLIESDFDYLKDERIVPFIVYQILIAVHYLHSLGIIHRNLKPSNILLDENCIVKITGLTYATYKNIYENTLKGETNYYTEEKITLNFIAPEILSSKKKSKDDYDEKCDIWSIGCILASLLTKMPSFFIPIKRSNIKWEAVINGIFKKFGRLSKEEIAEFASKERAKDIMKFKNFPKPDKKDIYPNLKDDAIDLIEKLLQIDPKKRISILEAKDHPFFDVIKDMKKDDDFNFDIKPLSYDYQEEIEKMEKEYLPINEQIEFYKDKIELFAGNYEPLNYSNGNEENNDFQNYYSNEISTGPQTY